NQADAATRKWLTTIANLSTVSGVDAMRLGSHVALCKEQLWQADAAQRRRLSAELNGIAAALDQWKPRHVQHLLIHTDTATGQAAAKLVRGVLQKEGQQAHVLTAGGLRTDSSFREALADLTKQLEEWISGYREKSWVRIFNLTGGFKSVKAYLQAL